MKKLLCLVVFLSSGVVTAVSLDSDTAGRHERLDPSGIQGALVLCGGGETPKAAIQDFVKLAGREKAHLVIIPTASKLADSEPIARWLDGWKEHQPASVEVLHTRSRSTANDDGFLAPLRKATAVWISGGDQSRLAEVYGGTQAEKELTAVLKRGGVIGGTSAGAAIMSRIMIAGGKSEAHIGRGFDLLPGAIIDQHFTQRDRQNRLFDALAKHPGAFGIGIDENTAVIVRGRRMSVHGNGTVTLSLHESPTRPRRTVELRDGGTTDLTAWRRAALARSSPPFPAQEPVETRVPRGSLLIVGGGRLPEAVVRSFIDLAGGVDAPIVVLPTATEGTNMQSSEANFLKRAGAKNVTVLPARERREVESPENLAQLEKATGIWFGGGRQWRFVDAYEGTKALALFHDVLKRGGVIGGSSAGATIQGDYLCRGSPLNNTEMMCEGYERGFGFLPGTSIDQHFAQRNRFADMSALMKTYPLLLGIGIDEETALVVKGTIAEVIGKGKVHFYGRGNQTMDGQSDYESVKPDGRYDLLGRKVLTPSP